MNIKKQKVAVALSGGVDSSVAAALLKQQGYEVVGVHMKLWSARPNKKTQRETQERLKKVAFVLGISLQIVDLGCEFKKRVVNYFLGELKKGRTPNPCVVCNKEIKFGLLLELAKKLGADFLATGHYIRKGEAGNIYQLLKAKNLEKDQSYFLWKLNQKQLKRLLFPIGNFKSKREVREVAAKLGLPTAQTTESNDVCFLQNIDIDSFLQSYGDGLRKVGKITTKDGEAIGEHQGLCFYTIGQRKGIGLSDGPWFVIAKDIKKNTLVVSKNEKDLLQKELIAENINWISGVEPKLPLKVRAKVRYRSELSSATIVEKMGKARYKIIFINSQRAVTCGQSVVFYRGDELLGGGIIS